MTRSVPMSLVGVTHYGDLGANFNQGGPVYVACRGCVGANFNRGCPSVDRPSGQGSSCRGGRVKAAGGLPAKVGTTRRSCGVGGRDGQPLIIARLAMER
ncbi:hypothetical protein CDL15_Pgr023418 [Punica granatum]|uniref:Uncharacterized protein n=1 Tax=Punica granatum TaxID=22663 RepID=A0A218XR87_PUNGR|nr:hypothetical protein CDL15_Pgr023418 [Punica granatum]